MEKATILLLLLWNTILSIITLHPSRLHQYSVSVSESCMCKCALGLFRFVCMYVCAFGSANTEISIILFVYSFLSLSLRIQQKDKSNPHTLACSLSHSACIPNCVWVCACMYVCVYFSILLIFLMCVYTFYLLLFDVPSECVDKVYAEVNSSDFVFDWMKNVKVK